MSITLDSIIKRKDDGLMGGEMGDETVLMDMNTGDYLGLNGVGSSIWKQIQTPKKVADICTSLQEEYEVDAATCQTQTLKYLHSLLEENMVEVQ